MGNAVALQPDGKVVVAGFSTIPGNSDFAVARLGSNGSLDSSFGSPPGRSRADFGGIDLGQAVALQPDGKIVVAGTSDVGGNNDFAVARLGSNGFFDGSFGSPPGRSRADFGGTDGGEAVALQPDGKIIVAGSTYIGGNSDFAVARLGSNGLFDGSFGSPPGRSRADFGGSEDGFAAALQPDGKIVVAGSIDAGGNFDFAVARLGSSGFFDSSFGSPAGRSRADFGGTDGGRAIALQPDGKIVVAGSTYAGGNTDFAVARLGSNGFFDGSFGNPAGRSRVDFGGSDTGFAVALQPDGKIVVAGYTYPGPGGKSDFAVARLQPNGQLDTTFGRGGKATVDFGSEDEAQGVALQRDGKIVVAGSTDLGAGKSDFAVARLQGDPGGFGGGGGGSKRLRCAGKRATIIGTNGRDKLKGTRTRDVIVSLGGNDSIRAGGGADLVCAGSGKDKVVGGSGNDKLYGQGGKDRLSGQRGKDVLIGGAGADRLSGGPGRDRLLGGGGRDRLIGGAGRDLLRGGPGRDSQRQ